MRGYLHLDELRVHGVSGTPPHEMLYTNPVTYDRSDRQAKIYEPNVDPWRVKAFHWGSLTAGSAITAFWILLAPFAMANAAGWMLDRNTKTTRTAVRLAGLFLTGLFIAQTANIVLDVAYSTSLEDTVESTLLPTLMFIGAGLLVLGFGVLSTQSTFTGLSLLRRLRYLFGIDPSNLVRHVDEEVIDNAQWNDPADGAALTDDAMWTPHGLLHRLRRIHLTLGFSVLVVVGTWDVPGMEWLLITGVALALASVALVSATSIQPEARWLRHATAYSSTVGLILVGITAGWIASLGITDPAIRKPLFSGAGETALIMTGLLVASSLILLVERSFTSTAVVVGGAYIGASLGITGGVLMASLLSEPGVIVIGDNAPSDPEKITAIGMLILTVVVVVLALILQRIPLDRMRPLGRLSTLPDEALPSPTPAPESITRRAALRSKWILGVTAVVAIGMALFGAILAALDLFFDRSTLESFSFELWYDWQFEALGLVFDLGSLVGFALLFVVVVPATLILRSMIEGWRDGESRRKIGILWDLGSFWPRWYHPMGPPAYGPNAVDRLTEEVTARNPLVLAGHSQGSLISAVALSRIEDGKQPALFLTYGSQLGILYPLLFPTVGFDQLVEAVDEKMYGRWINLWRRSDQVGGHYVPHLGDANWHVNHGAGHSSYELTNEYCVARECSLDPAIPVAQPIDVGDCWNSD